MQWPITTGKDVVDAWIGDDAPDNDERLGRWVQRAERKIRREVPGITGRLAASGPDQEPDLPELVRDVVIDMVTSVYRNPEQIRQMQDSTGPFSGSVTFGGENPGALVLTRDHLSTLALPSTAGKAFEIDLMTQHDQEHPLQGQWINGPSRFSPGGSWS